MRWFKFSIVFLVIILGLYGVATYAFVEENKVYKTEKTIDYSLEKVYPQFSNFQNFVKWNTYFSTSKTFSFEYYQPYEGLGSSMAFKDKAENGTFQIFYEKQLKVLKYDLYRNEEPNPTKIEIKFLPLSPDKTKISWTVTTPKKDLLDRMSGFWSEGDFINMIDKSMVKLSAVLSNKIDKDNLLTDIKYDSIMVETREEEMLLGVNVSSSNKGDALIGNIIVNYNKVTNYVTNDLEKQEDEVGFPVLLTTASNFKDKEVSYFLGYPLNKKVAVTDNNFSYRDLKASQLYTIYFKGSYASRAAAIQKLLQKAKADNINYGELQQVFLETPQPDQEVKMKISLTVNN